MFRTRYNPDKLWVPNLWMPPRTLRLGAHDGSDAKTYIPCTKKQFYRLMDMFDSKGRRPMTVEQFKKATEPRRMKRTK